MHKLIIYTTLLLSALLVGCIAHGTYDPDEDPKPQDGGDSGSGSGSGDGTALTAATFQTDVTGLSGICYNKDKSGFLAVSDKIGVFELNLDGTTKRRLISYKSGTGKDFEAITIDYATGNVYVAEERERRVYKLNSTYTDIETFATITNVGTDTNKGLEGLTFDQNGTLYIGNQEDPWVVVKYSVTQHNETGRLQNLGRYFTYISDLCYDTTDNTLWVVDSKQNKVFHCSAQGVPFEYQAISLGKDAKAEALLVDKSKGVMWVGDDTSGKLHRIRLNMTSM